MANSPKAPITGGQLPVLPLRDVVVYPHMVLPLFVGRGPVDHDGTGMFEGLPDPFVATRYHSLVVEDTPDCLAVNATSETPGLDGTAVMGFRHKELPIHGVQFHPESIATENGHDLLANFLRLCGMETRQAA